MKNHNHLPLGVFLDTLAAEQERAGNAENAAELRRRKLELTGIIYDRDKAISDAQQLRKTLRRLSAEIERAAPGG